MVKQYEIYWISLNPIKGSEINKTRPCLVISPNVSNKHLNAVIIAPITSTIKNFPMRLAVKLQGKTGQVALDQMRCIDKIRLQNKIEVLDDDKISMIKSVLKEYLID